MYNVYILSLELPHCDKHILRFWRPPNEHPWHFLARTGTHKQDSEMSNELGDFLMVFFKSMHVDFSDVIKSISKYLLF